MQNTSPVQNQAHQRFGSGQAVLRIEDDKLLSGQGRFTDDITSDASYDTHLRLFFVRSPYPHAVLRSIDKSVAAGMPGVAAVFDGADLVAAGVKPIPGPTAFKRAGGANSATPARRALAFERVR
ncbi:MAG: xanthine dehydrogenase family protein molybdopterin-binding subunit, partial [Burkholderiales bacterium]|nr:xanthine dehydrogenase family protein molybdopterin-binding subunit [Burkholderiales bacterium]